MSLKERLSTGRRAIGCFASLPNAMAIEICASQGLDVLCVDAEHSQIDRSDLENLVRSCDVGGTPAMVRVPNLSVEWIGSALDAGAQAILVPRISTVEEAAAAARFAKYPPHGVRGAGPGRASGYGYGIQSYIRSANDDVLVAIQIETAEGLANVEAIAALPDIDMLFIGPFDLALSLGAFGPDGQARLEEAIECVAAAGKRFGKSLGIFRTDTADIERWSSVGFGFFLIGGDALFMGSGIAQMLAVARKSGEAE